MPPSQASDTFFPRVRIRDFIAYLFTLISLFPLLPLLVFYFHAAIVLGRFPRYNQPDPKQLAFYDLYSPIIDFATSVWFYSLLPWLVFLAAFIHINKTSTRWVSVQSSVIGQLIGILFLLSQIMDWYMD